MLFSQEVDNAIYGVGVLQVPPLQSLKVQITRQSPTNTIQVKISFTWDVELESFSKSFVVLTNSQEIDQARGAVSSEDFKDMDDGLRTSKQEFLLRGFNFFEVKIPNGVVDIGDTLFENYLITSLDLTKATTLKTIGHRAFENAALTNLYLSNNTALELIGGYAFYGSQLLNLDLSNNVALKRISHSTFENSVLLSLDLSKNVALETIGEFAFDFSQLTSLDLSQNIALGSIDRYAFGYSPMVSIQLPPQKFTVDVEAAFESASPEVKQKIRDYNS